MEKTDNLYCKYSSEGRTQMEGLFLRKRDLFPMREKGVRTGVALSRCARLMSEVGIIYVGIIYKYYLCHLTFTKINEKMYLLRTTF